MSPRLKCRMDKVGWSCLRKSWQLVQAGNPICRKLEAWGDVQLLTHQRQWCPWGWACPLTQGWSHRVKKKIAKQWAVERDLLPESEQPGLEPVWGLLLRARPIFPWYCQSKTRSRQPGSLLSALWGQQQPHHSVSSLGIQEVGWKRYPASSSFKNSH